MHRLDIVQNDSILPDQNMFQEAKCFNSPRPKYVPGGKMFPLYTTPNESFIWR